ncbi:pyocin activator PrtN family protein [Aliiroseovarius sp. F47248L]|uniref:pyocin activator PrtN family protein n=1 Tax=Aliiroseovarius sp. F47248L TaxID=2926420 RepID=UPI001FF40EE0|nr:pyocin activator PrtN family protein [Aliiroseovarius sp. F47248L]MCK0138650.1 pyocin activator PrtN family protein [Aliiroseovarius sp. F47248L]
MTTLMLLLARHDGQEEIPFRQMAREYFGIEPEALERKINKGSLQIDLPVERLKALRSSNIPLTHLARYIQDRRATAMFKMAEYSPDTSPR